MTTSTSPTSRLFTPTRILSAVAFLIVIFVLFAPQESDDGGAAFSSHAPGLAGTRALYETLGRLGFATSRNELPLNSPAAFDSTDALALLRPAQPLTAIEQARVLEQVRHGMVLLFTPGDGELADSLGFELRSPPNGFYTLARTSVAGGNPPTPATQDPRAAFQTAFPISVTVTSTFKTDNQTFLWLQSQIDDKPQPDSARQPALVLGHGFGQGYVIAVAPADILVNQFMREPQAAIAIVRALQFAEHSTSSAGQPRRIVFDEYHHGFGTHPDMPAAVAHALAYTAPGRATLGLVAAALLLLLAYAVRPLAPLSVPPISRRSPLEHVGALAHAYLQIGARRLATGMLVRGIRRRHSLGLPRSTPDTSYLSALRDRLPATSPDIDRIAAALAPDSQKSSDHFATIGVAVANIERAFRE